MSTTQVPAPTTRPAQPPIPHGGVVVGVDGSPESMAALTWAAEQALLEGRPLAVVHAIAPVQAWAGAYGYDPTLVEAEKTAAATVLELATTVLERDFPDVDVRTRHAAIDPRQALLDLAEHARMVVVGSRGRGPLARLVLGSVSTAVARHAACPVVVVRQRDPEAGARGILLGVDRDGHAPAAVEFAYRQAALRGLPLTVTHCCIDAFDSLDPAAGLPDHAEGTTGVGLPAEVRADTPGYEAARLVLDQTVAGMSERFPEVQVSLRLGLRPIASYLVEAARTRDMVVVGAHAGVVPFGFLLGHDIEHALVTHAPTIVAVVPEPV